MAERPLRAYNGDESYIFVAYSHEDSGLVYPQIRWLQDQGFNIAWDEGISPGAVWRSEIAETIRGCSLLLYFTTPNSVKSEHCIREVNFALDEHHRPVLAVHLLETVLPDALALSLSDRQAILQHALEPEDYERKLVSAVATYLAQPVPVIESSLPLASRKSSWQGSWSLALVCSLIVGSIAVLLTWFEMRSDAPAPSGMQLPLSLQHFSYHPYRSLALAADGRIAYVGVEEGESFLYLKSPDALQANKLPGTNGARTPFFSPNGNWLGFYAQGQLKRSPVGGGNPVNIAHSNSVMGASWGDDDHIVFTPGWGSPLMRIAADGGDAEFVTRQEDDIEGHGDPFVLPGSRAILYARGGQVWIEDLTAGESRYLTRGRVPQYYNGKLLFYRGTDVTGSLWMVNFDLDTLTTSGDPEPIVQETRYSFAINDSGALVYSVPSPIRNRLLLLDKTSGQSRVIAEEYTRGMRFSPDGQSLALPRTLNGQTDIWIYDLNEKGAEKQLSLDGGEWPIWSPDGTKIAYSNRGTGIVIRSTKASDPPTVLVETDVWLWPQQWNAQGILYAAINRETQGDLYFISNNGDKAVIADDVVASPHARISPDGAWIATTRYETGEPDVWIESFPDGGPRQRVPVVNGSWPTWSADGQALYVISYNRLMRVPVTQDTSGIRFGKPDVIREQGKPSQVSFDMYDVSPDQSQFVFIDVEYLNAPIQALILDWPEILLD